MQGILHSSLRLLSWLILLLICRSAFCSLNYWLFSVQWIEYQSESLLHSLLLLLLFFWSMRVFSLASRQWGSIYTFTTLCAPSSLNLCSRLHNLHNKSSESAFVFLFLVANTHKLALKQLCRFGVASLQYNFGFILIIFSLSLSLSLRLKHTDTHFSCYLTGFTPQQVHTLSFKSRTEFHFHNFRFFIFFFIIIYHYFSFFFTS